ncbi:MAG: hypothetical protein ACLGHN_02900 [Bacteriovoracia bacterium]
MAKSSYVLRALKILGLEEMLKLSEVLHVKQVPLKKAAGGEFIVWDDAVEQEAAPTPKSEPKEKEGKVLTFPKKTINDLTPLPEEAEATGEEETPSFLSSDLVLWQREIAKHTGDNIHRLDAFKGYKKSTEMYVVKTPGAEGKDKMRFASTNGVLINKKQA